MDLAMNTADDEVADVCLQCNSRREQERQASRSATRKVALLTAICCVLCVLTITACCCTLYLYTCFQGFRQELAASIQAYPDVADDLFEDSFALGHKAEPMYDGDQSEDEEYKDFVSEETNRRRHRRKKERRRDPKSGQVKGRKQNKQNCKKKHKKACDCCKQTLTKYIDEKVQDAATKIRQEISSPTTESPTKQTKPPVENSFNSYVSAAHYTTYVDENFITKKFGKLEHDFDKYEVQRDLDMPEWQGTLYRNRTFVTSAAPQTLKFFKEADWMENSSTVKIFDFDSSTGKFTARQTGLYHLYAHAQFRISRSKGIVMEHRTPSGVEILNKFQCGAHISIVGLRGIGKPCTLGGVVLMKEGEYIEIVLLEKIQLLTWEQDQLYFGAFFLQYV